MTALMVQVSAAGFAQKITFVKKNASLEQIFNEIRKQTGYDVLWLGKDLDVAQKINADFRQAGLDEVMQKSLADLKLSYTIEDKNIVIKKMPPSFLDRVASVIVNDDGKFADIRGVVRNERGEALEGITVMVKVAKTGTRTNARGEFVLKGIKKGDVLVFTGVAIEPFEYTVKDDKNIELNLKARLVQLEEVGINTGYQKISKERYVGSYSQLDSAAFHRRAGMGILERLDGTIAGLQFNKKGSTGAGLDNESPLQIRGLSTLNSNQNPLIIVDNFPYQYDLNTLNPNDVENVVVLKDAAATSIWGARAGNGVIVITTKKARYNQKTKIDFSSNINITDKPRLYSFPSISSKDFVEVEKFLFERDYYASVLNNNEDHPPVTPVIETLDRMQRGILNNEDGEKLINELSKTDYRKELLSHVYKKKISQQYNLNFSGGGQTLGYRFSLGYNGDGSAIQNSTGNDQFTILTSASVKPLKNLDISTGVGLTQNIQKAAQLPGGKYYPYVKLKDGEGNALSVPGVYRIGYVDTAGNGQLLDWNFRPLDEIKNYNNNLDKRSINLNVSANYRFTEWLSLQMLGQYSIQNSDQKDLYSLSTYYTRNLINQFTNINSTEPIIRNPVPVGAILNFGEAKSVGYNWRSQLSFNKSWGDHVISGLIAYDISASNNSVNQGRLYGYNEQIGSFTSQINYAFFYPQYGKTIPSQIPTGNVYYENAIQRFVSLTSNFSYSYKNRYTIYSSARRDATNLFGIATNQKWKPLWSIGLSWDLTQESFSLPNWIDDLKLKATYGYSGNVNNDIGSGYTTINYSSTKASQTGFPFAVVNTPPNPDLRWEEVRFGNFGIDFSIFNKKINGSIEFYSKATKDLIAPTILPFSSGVSTYYINSASLKGHGIDVNLSGTLTRGKFAWNPAFGLGYSKMKVAEIFSPNPYLLTRDFIEFAINPSAGKLAYSMSSYKWAGLDPLTGDPQGFYQGQISKDYEKLFNDTVGNQNYHGSAIPLISGYLSNTIIWKQLSLSFNITYKMDYYFRKPSLSYDELFTTGNTINDYSRRWQKSGDEKLTSVPSMIFPVPSELMGRDQFYRNSEVNVLRGDHIKLQDLRLQYILGNRVLRFANQINLFCYVNNLNVMIWKKDKSRYDPEFVGGSAYVPPPPVSVAFGLNIGL